MWSVGRKDCDTILSVNFWGVWLKSTMAAKKLPSKICMNNVQWCDVDHARLRAPGFGPEYWWQSMV